MGVKRAKYFRIIATLMADGVDVVLLMIEKGLGEAIPGRKATGVVWKTLIPFIMVPWG